jgi:phage terminase small subunit
MAGKPGRSGGARPGAGRPPKPQEPPPPAPPTGDTPLAFLLGVMNDLAQEPALRVRAAVAAAQYVHMKKGDGGKKEEQDAKAGKAAAKFSTAAPPRLISSR